MQADLIAVALDGAHQQPSTNPVDALIFSSSGRDVRMTMVAGKEIYRDDKVTTANEIELQSRLITSRQKIEIRQSKMSSSRYSCLLPTANAQAPLPKHARRRRRPTSDPRSHSALTACTLLTAHCLLFTVFSAPSRGAQSWPYQPSIRPSRLRLFSRKRRWSPRSFSRPALTKRR